MKRNIENEELAGNTAAFSSHLYDLQVSIHPMRESS